MNDIFSKRRADYKTQTRSREDSMVKAASIVRSRVIQVVVLCRWAKRRNGILAN